MGMPKVRIHLLTPLAFWGSRPVRPLMFDGLLAYVVALLSGYEKNPSELPPENLVDMELPLKKEGEGELWYWRASAMFVPASAVAGVKTIIRRYDWPEFVARAGLASSSENPRAGTVYASGDRLNTGWAHPYMEPYWYLSAPYLDFYFDGDVAEVVKLLKILRKDIGYLGSKRGVGHGRITSIEVYPESEDWSVWKGGKPTRPVPVVAADKRTNMRVEWWSYRPPYWHSSRKVLCYVPPSEQWWPKARGVAETLEAAIKK